MNIIIVDDDSLVALSLRTILEASGKVNILGIGKNGQEAISLYDEHIADVDVLLMDIRMDVMTGIEAAKVILKNHPDAKILFLTTFSDDEYIFKALQIGAKGYILKQNFESILPSLNAVVNGQSVFGNEIVDKIPNLLNTKKVFNYADYDITEKEYAIIKEIANGLSNKEIAQKLYLSEGTIRNYLSTILEKLCLRDRTQLAIFYYQNQ